MVDRVIVYPGALPQTTDVLSSNKFGLVGQAYQNRAILGTNTVVSGLACTPASPTANLTVTIGVGSIYQLDPTDQTAYGDLGIDNNSVMKQGILAAPVVLTITPPVTAGFSQVFLVQAILNDTDAGQLVLSYYNSANPASPYSGPANSGTSNFTTRTNPCSIALKAGIAAATGSQTTPSPDAGYVSLYAVTVVNGQTQITSPNIVQVATAPFFPTLPSVPSNVLNGSWVYAGQDTGAANAYVITFAAGQPIPTSYIAGMGVKFKALVTNTGASTINVNGLGVTAIRRATGVALAANDITSGQIVELTYDGTNFQMQNYLGAAATTSTLTYVSIPYVVDTGTVNALIGTYSPAITAGQQVAGLFLSIKINNDITGACTINVNGLGVKSVLLSDGSNPLFRQFVGGWAVLLLVYDGTQYQIVNTTGALYRKPLANLTIFVNGALGNDANDGVSNTSGHALATIGAGVKLAYSYAPSQFTITVVVEPGTYNEGVSTPSYAGPNLIIDGLAAASVVVNSANNNCFVVQGPNTLTVKNVTVQNSGTQTWAGFLATNGALMTTANTVSNNCIMVFAGQFGGSITPGTHTFSGSSWALYYALNGGSVSLTGSTHTISTSIAVSIATAYSLDGYIFMNSFAPELYVNPSFVSGPRYSAILNGLINVNGLGVNFFPGTIAGTAATGGQYA